MKTASCILWLLLAAGVGHAQTDLPSSDSADLGSPAPISAPASPAPEPSLRPELNELRDQLHAIRRSNEEATDRWEALAEENSALSNRLADLQQALLAQKDRELELTRESQAFNLKLLGAAALGLVLVVLLSYWFQLRCFNRVIEVTRSLPAYPPALLDQDNGPNSRLLNAIHLLENRIQQLEVPAPPALPRNDSPTTLPTAPATPPITNPAANGAITGSNHAAPPPAKPTPAEVITPTAVAQKKRSEPEHTPNPNGSMLMAKGQVLLDMDRLQEAADCYQEVIAIDPQNAEAHFKKGIAFERMNQLEQALEAYEETLRLNPKRSAAQVYKARVLQGLHRYDEALSVYDTALNKPGQKPGSTTFAT